MNKKYEVVLNGQKGVANASNPKQAMEIVAEEFEIDLDEVEQIEVNEKILKDRPQCNPVFEAMASENKHLRGLIDIFEGIHDSIASGEFYEDALHSPYWVYEAAAQMLYGENYFKWYNKNT